VKQIDSAVYEWSQYDPERRIDLNGHFVQAMAGQPGVVIDPVPFHPGDEAQLQELGGVAAVVLTGTSSAGRVQQAMRCREMFGCALLVPQSDLTRATLPGAEPFDAGSALPAGLMPVAIPDGAPGGQVALYQATSQTLVAGDAVVGAPAGQLSLPELDGSADHASSARGLRALLTQPQVQRLLVASGTSILRDPVRAIQDLIYRHDPASFMMRLEEAQWNAWREGGTKFGVRNALVSRLVGLEILDFDLTEIPPGRQNYPLHRHDGKEELFIVLEGQGEVRTEAGTFAIEPGLVLAFPPRYQIAHVIQNTGQEPLRFLSFAAQAEHLDTVDYPDTGQHAEGTRFGKRRRFFLPERTNVGYWEGTQTE
jgi:uncharacterized cupin superfamily protein